MHIHILGIAGTMTAPLAAELKRMGYEITGTDQKRIYPPVSTILKKANIKINQPLLSTPQLAIIGSSYKAFSNTQAEFEAIKKNKTPFLSATRYISKFIIKKKSILVAGSYGKTTITSLIAWILHQSKLSPSYMFGGESLNKIPSLSINNSDWSVVEADESINGLDTKAKFLYYPVKYLLLTSADWEHKDSYKTEEDNTKAFKQLITRIPQSGLLIYCSDNPAASKLASVTSSSSFSYGNSQNADYRIIQTRSKPNRTRLQIQTPQKKYWLTTSLFGNYNYQNILAAFALCHQIGIEYRLIKKAIAAYKGIKRRLEVKSKSNGIVFIDDFAQAPFRISSALQAINSRYPHSRIYVIFEPHASFLSYKSGIKDFAGIFDQVEKVVLTKIPFKPDIDKDQRVTAKDYKEIIGSKFEYLPLKEQLIEFFTSLKLKSGDLVVHFSSGGLEGLQTFRHIINYYKK